jgi:thiamine biosynthesis lipoprotein
VISRAHEVMGTVVSFAVDPGARSDSEALDAIGSALAQMQSADDTFSLWKPHSPMSRLRRGETVEAVADIEEVVELCARARDLSGGWFDPWAVPGGFDPTGLVKGWAAGKALGVLAGAGMAAAMVNAGGDIAVLPGRSWRIGIRHPWRPGALACVVDTDRALATSGCYERGPHLVSPRAGGHMAASATVAGPDPALADALATALAVSGDEGLGIVASIDGYDGYLVAADGTETATEGFEAMLSPA